MHTKFSIIFLLSFLTNFAIAADLTIATTTSTKGSGLLDSLIPAFEKYSGYKLKVFSVGTGTALRMGRQGKVDILLVHAPPAEKMFISDGYGVLRTPVMKNDFVLVGPKNDPAKINSFKDINKAFKQIYETQKQFVSRGDDSGTHKKEMIIWDGCKIMPYGDWYYETGVGMGASLQMANGKSAYILIDKGTWLAKRKSTNLIIHVEDDSELTNPYHVIAVNPKKYPNVNFKAAKNFIKWITGKHGNKIINELRIDGEQLFTVTQK